MLLLLSTAFAQRLPGVGNQALLKSLGVAMQIAQSNIQNCAGECA